MGVGVSHLFKKYFDVDSQKWIRDKLEKIRSYSLGDIINDTTHNYMIYSDRSPNYYSEQFYEDESTSKIYNFPKFIPKDNDFDKEEIEYKKQQERILKEKEEAYQKQLAEAEKRVAIQNEARYIQKSIAFYIKNNWVPK